MTEAMRRAQDSATMDMTPMIDCVFLLMIFFVLVIDLSQTQLEDLILPAAKYAVPDEKPPEKRPIINIKQDGSFVYRKNVIYDPAKDGENFEKVKDMLIEWRDKLAKPENIKPEKIGPNTITIVDEPVLVRADKWTEWHFVGKFMEQCTFKDAAFPKLELALSEKDKEDKLFKKQGQ